MDVVKEIVSAAQNGITPPAIREVIKSYYPEFYATDRHKMHVERGNFTDLDHALLAQIYGVTRSSRAFILDRTTRPMIVHMANVDHQAEVVPASSRLRTEEKPT